MLNPRHRQLTALTLMLAVATAQAENEDVIAHCARISSPGDRILCLEDALRSPVQVELAEAQDEVPTDTVQAPQETLPETGATKAGQFGLAEEQKNPDPLESVDAVVVAVSQNAYGKLIFTTDNGQVWQQTDQRNARYRDLPVDATIRSGASGSFFIQPKAGGIASRVKRIK